MIEQHCPTCGSPVQVVGTTTLHYEPVASEEIARLRKALEFYADLKNWKTDYEDLENDGGRYVTSPILQDEGQRAYEALEAGRD